jgi:hypothetical protein
MTQQPVPQRVPGAAQDITGFPAGKISETLLEFAGPLLDMLEKPWKPEPLRQSLTVATLVWNSVVLEEWGIRTESLERANELFRAIPDAVRKFLFDELLLRKHSRFAEDRRLIGNFEIEEDNGELRVRADACLPRLASVKGDDA